MPFKPGALKPLRQHRITIRIRLKSGFGKRKSKKLERPSIPVQSLDLQAVRLPVRLKPKTTLLIAYIMAGLLKPETS